MVRDALSQLMKHVVSIGGEQVSLHPVPIEIDAVALVTTSDEAFASLTSCGLVQDERN